MSFQMSYLYLQLMFECEAPMRQPVTYWQDAWKRFTGNKTAVVSAIFIILITLLAILIRSFQDIPMTTDPGGRIHRSVPDIEAPVRNR